MAIITMENLKYKYPGTDHLALNGITLSIEKGEFIGIVGQNGAGKSTLCQAIIGLVPQFYHGAYGGFVKVKGRLAEKVPVQELCEDVGLIFQNPFNQLSGARDTVYGEVAYGLQNLGIRREEMQVRIEKVLKQLDICRDWLWMPEEMVLSVDTVCVNDENQTRILYIPEKKCVSESRKLTGLLHSMKGITDEEGIMYLETCIQLVSVENLRTCRVLAFLDHLALKVHR